MLHNIACGIQQWRWGWCRSTHTPLSIALERVLCHWKWTTTLYHMVCAGCCIVRYCCAVRYCHQNINTTRHQITDEEDEDDSTTMWAPVDEGQPSTTKGTSKKTHTRCNQQGPSPRRDDDDLCGAQLAASAPSSTSPPSSKGVTGCTILVIIAHCVVHTPPASTTHSQAHGTHHKHAAHDTRAAHRLERLLLLHPQSANPTHIAP